MTGTARPLNLFVCAAIGAGAAAVGLLPWIIAGLRLPLQNLWASGATFDAMPLVLLPFSQYALTTMTGMLVTGAALAGGVVRVLRSRRLGSRTLGSRTLGAGLARGGAWAVWGGVLLIQVIAVVQTSIVVWSGLRRDLAGTLYFVAILGTVLLSIALGILVFWLIAAAPRPGATIGLSIAALAVGAWAGAMVVPPFSVSTGEVQLAVARATYWLPPVIIGAAIAWCGVRTIGRAVAAVASLVIVWLGPAAITAISAATGSRVLARFPGQMAEYAGAVFVSALGMPALVLPQVLLAAAVAAVLLVARRTVRVRRAVAAAPPSP